MSVPSRRLLMARGGDPRIEALWLYGSYTDDTHFSFGIRGAGYR